MREAVGTTAFLQILMIFIVIFISFLAVSVNFAQAFRVKNKIISYIEANEVWEEGNATDQQIATYLDEINYTGRFSITPYETSRGRYYRVATSMSVDIPVIGQLIESFQITGETKIIYTRE